MLTYWALPLLLLLLLLRAAGTHADQAEPRSFNVDSAPHREEAASPPAVRRFDSENPAEARRFDSSDSDLQNVHDDGYPEMDVRIRRFECPAGFFRLRRNCYYLSGGVASWRDAHFQCMARNASLAVLNTNGKDKILRKYLMGDQFRKLERWIGGIYNWRQMNWEWGGSGDKVLFQSFGNADSMISTKYIHHCIVLDPLQQYKWNARRCFEPKYYICEVPAGRLGRRRKNVNDPLAPQNQRLRPSKKDEYKYKTELRQRKRKPSKLRSMRKKIWHQQEDNQIWAHGIIIGSRPPKGSMRTASKRVRPKESFRHGRNKGPESRISQVTPRTADEFGAFAADGRGKAGDEQQLQSLGNNDQLAVFPRLGNDFTREEVLLKL